jgi:TonB family protein
MKTDALILTLLLLSAASGQDSAKPQSGAGYYRTCRGDEADSADCITSPRATYSPAPEHPTNEQDKDRGGTVSLGLVVGTDGLPHDVNVLESLSAAFDAAAVDGVKKWKFSPATQHGKPVRASIVIQVTFHAPSGK